jgi:hypothetical protein
MPPGCRLNFVVSLYSLQKYDTLTIPNRDALTLANAALAWHAFDGLGCRGDTWGSHPFSRLVNQYSIIGTAQFEALGRVASCSRH